MQEWEVYPLNENYEIHPSGKVRNIKSGKELSIWTANTGFRGVTLYQDNKKTSPSLHRVMAETFLDEPDDSSFQAHLKDGNKENCTIENIEWRTWSEINTQAKNSTRDGLKRGFTAVNGTSGETKRYKSKGDALTGSGVGRKAFDKAVSNANPIKGWKFTQIDNILPAQGAEIRDIPGFPKAKASSDGLIYKPTGGWTAGSDVTGKAYKRVIFGKDEQRVHKLIAITFLGSAPLKNAVVNHKNGNGLDNRAENLEWTTVSDNALHATSTGLLDNKVAVTQLQDGKVVKEWPMIRDAAQWLVDEGLSVNTKSASSAISQVLSGTSLRAYEYDWRITKQNAETSV